jgi:hypothetical protein
MVKMLTDKEFRKAVERISKSIETDPRVQTEIEHCHWKYGTLSDNALKRRFKTP